MARKTNNTQRTRNVRAREEREAFNLPNVVNAGQGVVGQREVTRVQSRPAGTSSSRNVDITNMSPEQAERIKKVNAAEGRIRKEQEEEAIEARARANILEGNPEAKALQERQTAELSAVNPVETRSDEGQLDRFAKAGAAVIAGLRGEDPGAVQDRIDSSSGIGASLAKGALVPAGALATVSIPVIDLSIANSLFGKYSKVGDQRKGDADAIASSARLIASSVKSGAPPAAVIENLKIKEANVRLLYSQAEEEYRKNPQNAANGLEITGDMNKQLSKVIAYRQVVERYQLDGNLAALDQGIGTLEMEEAVGI